MDVQNLVTLLLTALVVDLFVGLVKKSPPYLIAPFVRLWKETTYLHNVLHNKRFAQWKPQAARYVALRAIKAQNAKQETPHPVLDLLEAFLKRGTLVVLLGEPGAGKTTALEALTYRLAQRAYRFYVLLWFDLLSIAALLLIAAPILTVLWLVSFFLWESFVRRATIPFFLEARSDYAGGDVKEWRANILKEHWGGKSLWGSYSRVAWLVDGINEVFVNLYPTFVEGWRGFLQNKSSERVVFTSRAGENPTPRLGLHDSLTILDLDDSGVREFLRVYGREKAALEKQTYADEQAERDFEELQNKNLLGEKGIGRNPYWLKMVVESGLYTRNRGVLFHNFAEKLIRREIEEKPEERKRKPDWTRIVPLEVEMDALASLALAMHADQRIGLSDETGWNRARAAIRESAGDTYSLDDVLCEAEAATLVHVQFKERVEFVHQLVQEFFAAFALRHESKWQIALNHAEDVWWWQTLFIMGGLLSEDHSLEAYNRFLWQVLGNRWNDQHLFATIGLIGSIENPSKDFYETILRMLVESISETLTYTQQHVAKELGRLSGDDVAELFGILLHNADPHIKTKGALLLCAIGGRRAARILLREIDPDDPITVLVPDRTAATDLLITALRDPDELLRWRAVGALYGTEDEHAIKPLITALHDTDDAVRRGAAHALRRVGVSAVKPLITALQDPDRNVREVAAEALGMIEDKRALAPLIVAVSDPNKDVREMAVWAMKQIADEDVVELVLAIQRSYIFEDWKAKGGLKRIEVGSAVEGLSALLHSPDKGVRARAAEMLGQIEDARTIEPLIVLLCDSDANVRERAAEALGQVGDTRALSELERVALEDKGGILWHSVADTALEAVEKIRKRMKSTDKKR